MPQRTQKEKKAISAIGLVQTIGTVWVFDLTAMQVCDPSEIRQVINIHILTVQNTPFTLGTTLMVHTVSSLIYALTPVGSTRNLQN